METGVGDVDSYHLLEAPADCVKVEEPSLLFELLSTKSPFSKIRFRE